MAAPVPTSYQQQSIGFADQIAPYAEKLLGTAEAYTDPELNPYMQYMGDRVAQFTPLQQQSYKNAGLMQTAPQLQDASAMAGMAGLGALNTQYTFDPYQSQSITGGRQQSYPAQIPGTGGGMPMRSAPETAETTDMPYATMGSSGENGGPARSSLSLAGAEEMPAYAPQQLQVMPQQGGFGGQQQGQTPQAPQNTLQQYMNPYMQNVVERQQADAQRQSQIAGQAQGAQAARSGAFGGSGDYLMRGQAAGNLARQKGDIQAQGLNNAYTQAMSQFNTEQQQRQAAAQLNAQQQQFGAGLGLQGLQTANQAASNLANIGQTQYGQNMGILGMQNQFGGQQQQQVQNVLNNQYGDFLSAQNHPYKQMGFMSDMIRGLPMSQLSSTMYQQPPSMVQQVAGLGLAGKALSAFASGGAVGSRPAGLAELALYRMSQD